MADETPTSDSQIPPLGTEPPTSPPVEGDVDAAMRAILEGFERISNASRQRMEAIVAEAEKRAQTLALNMLDAVRSKADRPFPPGSKYPDPLREAAEKLKEELEKQARDLENPIPASPTPTVEP